MRNKLHAFGIRSTLALSLFLSGCTPLLSRPHGDLAIKAESQRIAWAIKSLGNPKLRAAALDEILDWSYESIDLKQMPQMDKGLSGVFEQDFNPVIRIKAAKVVRRILRDINSRRKDGLNLAIGALVKLINEDSESEVAFEAVKTLGHYRGSKEDVIPALKSITLRSNNRMIGWQALHCLVCAGEDKDKNNQALRDLGGYHPSLEIMYRARALLEYHLYYDHLMCRTEDQETYIFEKRGY
ncbi:hypothetical protein HY988_06045 [Candidatus Micrarchaeota archaeon]|nr:hypothetical protein [Candidatus Micrarchaeota archaeon]